MTMLTHGVASSPVTDRKSVKVGEGGVGEGGREGEGKGGGRERGNSCLVELLQHKADPVLDELVKVSLCLLFFPCDQQAKCSCLTQSTKCSQEVTGLRWGRRRRRRRRR